LRFIEEIGTMTLVNATTKHNPKSPSAMTLTPTELHQLHGFWRACNYLAAGMIYLQDNPLLREPLQPEHIKNRLLGHWGTSPGLSFIYTHLNRIINKFNLNAIYLAGPGHGAPGVLAPVYLEGSYTEIYTDKTEDLEGMRTFFRQFSFPGGIGSHCTPETPGSIHEGGELGYSISHAYGAVFDNPDLISVVVIGDGEAETGALATAWHSNKFLDPRRDGVVLPILHLNGYKINNPTILARISHQELEQLLQGYGYTPYFVEGDDYDTMHQTMAATLDTCIAAIHTIQTRARAAGDTTRPMYPAIVFRSPKGWTGPKSLNGHQIEGSWRSHQVPLKDVKHDSQQLQMLVDWLQSYRPDELFDADGKLKAEFRSLAPQGMKRMGSNPHANGGVLRKSLRLPDFGTYGIDVATPGQIEGSNTYPLGEFIRDIILANPDNFRLFGPDETASNQLQAVYETTQKVWWGTYLPEDADGSEMALDGRVMEMLSEHTLEGWLEGYLLTGRHGLLSTYEAFVHVIDSMFNQHAKWLEISRKLSWRSEVASLNLLITSTVWRQDHNGFTHQDPGFLDVVANKSMDVVRIYLPPDVNCLLTIADRCFRSTDRINTIVSDKQPHLQYLTMDAAIAHCTKGIGIWEWASTDRGTEPDVVIACAGDIPTQEALAATAILHAEFADLKIRFINVVDLLALQQPSEYLDGLTDRDFDSLFTLNKPIIFNFHGYPWLIHRLTYRRTNHHNLHVRGYKEKGNINTPLELAMNNQIDRFSIAIDCIDRVSKLQVAGAHIKERLKNRQIECRQYAYTHGIDLPEVVKWRWQNLE
jgi:xylulose-5-phosphate/fructose-6-phosphate phosphoketolase